MKNKTPKKKTEIKVKNKTLTINPDAECGLCQKEIPEGDGYCNECLGQI